MELIDRFAYHGMKVMLPTFMVDAFGEKGPILTQGSLDGG